MLKSKLTFCACALLVAVIFCQCHGEKITDPTINKKYYTTFWDTPMPKGICRFCYETDKGDGCVSCFEDSCHFYNVGDRVGGKK